jgi:GT2 family glycosyltransferase
MSELTVSVIVPHLNDLPGLTSCIAALERQTLPRDRFEIVVADNGSQLALETIAAAVPGARVVRIAERGAGPARNGGVMHSRNPVLAFTDSDCLPEPHWLEAGLEALAVADLVGGAMVVTLADPTRPTPAEAFEAVFAFDNRTYVERKGFSVTANLFTTRAVFDAVGGFRTKVSEDVDWCWRASRLGYRIAYAPGAVVAHPARRTWSELVRKWRRLSDERLALERETGLAGSRLVLEAAALAFSPALHAGRVLNADRLDTRAKFAALGVLVRLRLQRAHWLLHHLAHPTEKAS